MANFLQRLLTGDTARLLTEAQQQLNVSTQTNEALAWTNSDLNESIRDLSLYLEDLNWIPVDGWTEEKGFSLDIIKEQSDRLSALLAVNPTIKKAINARHGYIWSRGVKFEGTSVRKTTENAHNSRVLFDDSASWKNEAQLATTGNIWAARNKKTDEITLVPIDQLAGWVVDENDPSRVTYWLRSYTVQVKNFNTGIEETKYIKYFVKAYDHTGTIASIDGIPVNRDFEMIHLAANRQEGWILGIPDIMAAMFWAKGHKELFEAGTAFVKAQGKFASKVVAKTQAGASRTAAAIAGQPRRNEETGEVLEYGGTAVMSAGLDMQLMGKMSGGVDFKSFDPVAGLIAVGLDVPLGVILGTADGDDKSLEETTVAAMRDRQKLWSWFFRALFSPKKVQVVWPKIKTEPEYRRIQSVGIANDTNVLSRAELRGLTLEAFAIDGDPNKLPDIEEQPEVAKAIALAKIEVDTADKIAKATASALPDQGVTGEVGKLSNGADAKDARDNPSDPNVANS